MREEHIQKLNGGKESAPKVVAKPKAAASKAVATEVGSEAEKPQAKRSKSEKREEIATASEAVPQTQPIAPTNSSSSSTGMLFNDSWFSNDAMGIDEQINFDLGSM